MLDPLHMLGFGEHQPDEQRSDRLRHMDRFREPGDNEQPGENDEQEQLIRANIQQPVEQRNRFASDDQHEQHKPERDGRGQEDASQRGGAAENKTGDDRDVDSEKYVLEHNDAEYHLRLRIGRTFQINQHLGHDRTGGNRRNPRYDKHLQKGKPRHEAEQETQREIDRDINGTAYSDGPARFNQPPHRKLKPQIKEQEQNAYPAQKNRSMAHFL